MAPPNSAQQMARGGVLDALRALAAMFILVSQAGDEAPVPLRQVHDLFGRGDLAGDVFLILSGFVLARVYGRQMLDGSLTPARFLARRAVRNYPAHLITLAGLVLMALAAAAIGHPLGHPERFAWPVLPIHLLMLQGWGLAPGAWNIPTWTISALFACYAAFPWFWPALQRFESRGACILAGLLTLLASDLAARVLTGHALFGLSPPWGLLRTVPLFLLGLCLARLAEVADLENKGPNIAVAGAAALAANVIFPGPDLLSVIAICAVIVGGGAMGASVRIPGAAWGARISFSLFFTCALSDVLYNGALRPILLGAAHGSGWASAVWGGELAFALVVAIAFDRFVDVPLQRRLRGLLFRGSPAPRLAPAPSA